MFLATRAPVGQTFAQLPHNSHLVFFQSSPNGASIKVLVPTFELRRTPFPTTLLHVLTHR